MNIPFSLRKSELKAASSQRSRKPYSITKRLSSALVVTVILVAGLATGLFYLNATRQAAQSSSHKVDEMMAFLTGALEPPLWDLDKDTVRVICETFAQNELIASIVVREPSGNILFTTGHHQEDVLARKSEARHQEELIGTIELSLSKDSIQQKSRVLLLPFATTTILILITLLLFTKVAIRIFVIHPLERLNDIVSAYSNGHYDIPAGPLPYREFHPFSGVLQEMGQKIQSQVAQLQYSEEKYRSIIEQGVEGIFQSLPSGQLLEANPAFARILGYDSPAEAMHSITDIGQQVYVEADDRIALLELFRKQDTVTNYEVRFRQKDQSIIWAELHARAIRNKEKILIGLEGFMTDITERRKAEERLKISLQEKEGLLRELYHRTKNNMQVISAMLTLQALHSNDPEVARVFKEMENKIDSMALVHRMLYQSQDLSQINFHDYIHNLVDLLKRSYRISPNQIAIELEIAQLPVLIDTAIPCGLILNELISNAFKHAFPGARKGNIRIQLAQLPEGSIELSFMDDGVGVAPDFDFSNQQTLGMQSIYAIAKHQLQGELQFTGQPGVSCIIRFRNDLYTSRV